MCVLPLSTPDNTACCDSSLRSESRPSQHREALCCAQGDIDGKFSLQLLSLRPYVESL